MRFAALDVNKDGVITRREWNGSDRSFEVHDWNQDGILSGEEVRQGATRRTPDDTAHRIDRPVLRRLDDSRLSWLSIGTGTIGSRAKSGNRTPRRSGAPTPTATGS